MTWQRRPTAMIAGNEYRLRQCGHWVEDGMVCPSCKARTPRTYPAPVRGDPGNDGVYVVLPNVCLFCATRILPGDSRWVCWPCFRELRYLNLEELMGHTFDMPTSKFSPLVSVVWNSSVTELKP